MLLNRIRDACDEARAVAEMAALALANPLFFALRSAWRFRRAGYAESPAERDPLPEPLLRAAAGDRAQTLIQRYELGGLRPRLSPSSWLLTLYYADVFDTAFARADFAREALGAASSASLEVLDIGAKNFIAAPALWHILAHGPGTRALADSSAPRPVRLSGVEIDGWRILRGWHSRHDLAQYYLGLLPAGSPVPHAFLPLDFMQLEGQFDCIVWFHPFLDAYPLLHWGLPRRLLRPEAMFAQMLARLRPGGLALIVNQELHEDEVQRALIAAAGPAITRHFACEHATPFSRRTAPGYIHLLQKKL